MNIRRFALVLWTLGVLTPAVEADPKIREAALRVPEGDVAVSHPRDRAAAYSQCCAAVAGDRQGFVIAWNDRRSEVPRIYAARIGNNGILQDPMGFDLDAPTPAYYPRVAAGPGGYLITYHHLGELRARLFSFEDPFDAVDLLIASDARIGVSAVASNSTDYFVVWEQEPTGQMWGSLISADGRALSSTPITADRYWQFSVMTVPEGFVIASTRPESVQPGLQRFGIYLFRLDARGRLIRSTRVAESAETIYPLSAGSNGQTTFIAWRETAANWHAQVVRGLVVHRDDSWTGPFTISQSDRPETRDESVQVAWTGTSYLLAWSEYFADADLLAQRFSSAGDPVDAKPLRIRLPEDQRRPALVVDASGAILVWQSGQSDHDEADLFSVAGQFQTPAELAGLVENRVLLSRSSDPQSQLALATDGRLSLAVWREDTAPPSIRASIVGPALLTGPEVELSAPGPDLDVPSVAFGRDQYLVIWAEFTSRSLNIVGRRLSLGGIPIETAPFLIASRPCQSSPFPRTNPSYETYAPATALGWNGTVFLAAWRDCQGSGFIGKRLRAARISPSGAVVDIPPLEIDRPRASRLFGPAIAGNGTLFLIGWIEDYNGWGDVVTFFPMEVRAARMGSTGGLLDPDGILAGMSSAPGGAGQLRAASDGRDFLMVWPSFGYPDGFSIRAARLSSDGWVDSTGVFSASPHQRRNPDVVWRAPYYAVAWQQTAARFMAYGDSEIVGVQLRSDQPLPQTPPPLLRFVGSVHDAAAPRLIDPGGSSWLLGYRRRAPEPGHGGVRRLFLKLLERESRPRAVRR